MDSPRTLQDAIIYFADKDKAFAYAVNFRWPNGLVTCPRCGGEKHSFVKTRRVWFCYDCNKQFSLKVGTIFEDSPIALDKWMMVMWMLANCKNGVSSYEIMRSVGVTQKSAWFMLHRIREAMKSDKSTKMGGEGSGVEIDEAFVGGKLKNMHKSPREKVERVGHLLATYSDIARRSNKMPVMGMFDRNSREVRAKVVPNTRRETLQREILSNVEHGSKVYTDEAPAYCNTLKDKFIHETVNHLEEYVRGEVHTNCLENFWSLTKRNLAGTYVAVEPFHLDRYLDEQMFRFNNCQNVTDSQRFEKVLSQVAGKRLTYAQLSGAGSATAQ